jgi:hypothetical protein
VLTAVIFSVMQQEKNVIFCSKLDKTLTESYEILQTDYGDEALRRSSVFE